MYYEAILQLRDVKQEVHDYVMDEISQAKIPVTETKDLKNGVDIYLADSNFTNGLGKRLQKRFGGKVINTSSLFGRKDGKNIYRVTVLFRGVPVKKGDKVSYCDEPYIVKAMAKDILIQHEKSGKKVHINYQDVRQLKLA